MFVSKVDVRRVSLGELTEVVRVFRWSVTGKVSLVLVSKVDVSRVSLGGKI